MNSLVSRLTLLLTLIFLGFTSGTFSIANAQTIQNGSTTTGLAPNTGNANLTHHQRHAIRTSDGRFHIFLKTELKSDGSPDTDDDGDAELTSLKLYSSTVDNSATNYAVQLEFGASSSNTNQPLGGVDFDGSDSTCDVIADPANANLFHLVYNTWNDEGKSGIKYVRLTYSPSTHTWATSYPTQVIKADDPDSNGRKTYIRPGPAWFRLCKRNVCILHSSLKDI